MVLTREIVKHAQILWDYNALELAPQSADVLLVMGHNDLGVPRRAAEIAKKFVFKFIVVSGGVYHEKSPLGEPFQATEAEAFKREMVLNGILGDKILIENFAKNTGENITFTRDLLSYEPIKTVQLVHTPIMRRRTFATATKQWPGPKFLVTSEQIPFETYLNSRNPENVINTLVGDTARILVYPAQGFQVPQPFPVAVRQSLRWLISEASFSKNLPNDFDLNLL